ncbi:MAG TPA: phosphotransferase [Candidatus Saccharimonadales bacterium]|jgi:shikimate kinase
MPLIFITGAPGSGKSTVLQQLEKFGQTVYGTDEHGLSHWIHRITGEIVVPPEIFDVHEWYKEHEWKINPDEIKKLKEHTVSNGTAIFLCGVGDGIDEAWQYFDNVIVLVADEAILRQRILERKDNGFGRTPEELKIVLEWQNKHVPIYQGRGATIIDTSVSDLDKTVSRILDKSEELKLLFGSVSSPVKLGNTVRRQTGPWTPTVHSLLAYLHDNAFDNCPVVEGIDDENREILHFIPGDAAVRPWPAVMLVGDGIAQAARVLRRYHDVVEGFKPQPDNEWRIGFSDIKPGQIVRHGDLGPWNTIWQNGELTALIDWDFAQPGERIDDVAQMAYYFIPLRGEAGWKDAGFDTQPDFAERLQSLVAAYGMFSDEEVINALLRQLAEDREIMQRYSDEEKEPWVSFVKRGDIEESIRDSSWIDENRNELLR